MKVKFAVVGCGSIGKRHIAILDSDPNSEIVGICDIDPDKCKEITDLYGSIPTFTEYANMLDSVDTDIINVVTPHAYHKQMTIQACEKGFNVLVEKPMALNVADCEKMISAAKKNKVKLWVVKQNRFNVPVRLTTDVIKKGRLGKVLMIKCNILWNRYQGYYDDSPWRGKKKEEGGALFTQASHFIDLLIWWCGSVDSVKCHMETQNHNIETEDSGVAIMNFDSGTIGTLTWTTCVYNKNYEGSITIIGEKGTIKIGGRYLNKIEFWDVEGYPLQEGIEYSDKPNSYGKYQGTSSNHDKVVAAIIADLNLGYDGEEVVEGFEGMKTVAAIEKIYEAAEL